MKLAKVFGVGVTALLLACGAGDPGSPQGSTMTGTHDNVKACENFIKQVKCGSVDLSKQYPCASYSMYPCDISAYFDCVGDKLSCSNGQYDPIKLAKAGECASKIGCH